MELDKLGIAVAEYWIKLPPKEQFESKNTGDYGRGKRTY